MVGGAALVAAASALAVPAPAGAAGACAPGKPSVIVHLAGFKQPTGRVKLSVYDDSGRWLAKGGKGFNRCCGSLFALIGVALPLGR